MPVEVSKLDQMQAAYKEAVEQWISAIREEEALASVNQVLQLLAVSAESPSSSLQRRFNVIASHFAPPVPRW